MKFNLTDAELFQLLAEHFGVPVGGRWVMHLDIHVTRGEGGGYAVDVEFEDRQSQPRLRLVKS